MPFPHGELLSPDLRPIRDGPLRHPCQAIVDAEMAVEVASRAGHVTNPDMPPPLTSEPAVAN